MVSLTTVYGISIFLTSLAGMGAAFVGNKIYPITGGAVELPPTPADVKKATEEADKAASDAAVKAAKLAAADVYEVKKAQQVEQTPTPESVPEESSVSAPEPIPAPVPALEAPAPVNVNTLEEAIKTGFNKDDDFAKNVVDFIKTPVVNWETIAPTLSELRRKFMKTLTHANQNKCPAKLLDLCKIVSIKYSNMKDFIESNPYIPYGDQTEEVIALLSSNEQN
jgi:hypothetical protein